MTSSSSSSSCSWPWMSGAKCRLDDPIALVDELDKRPAVKDIIATNKKKIDQFKAQLRKDPKFNPNKHDDLWVLRFLLSHCGYHQDTNHNLIINNNNKHGVEKALDAAKSTLAFRHEYNLDELDIRNIPINMTALLSPEVNEKFPYAKAAGKMLSCYDDEHTMVYYIPDSKRGLLGFLQLAGRNPNKMIQTLQHTVHEDEHHHHHSLLHKTSSTTECSPTHDAGDQLHKNEYFEAHLVFTEWKFQWLDYLTRTSGRLTKYLGIADCHDVSRKMIHRDSKKQDSQAAKMMEDKYPQLLGAMLVVNAPIWIDLVFIIIKPFLPKRLLEKVNLIKPSKKERDLLAVREYISLEHLPVKYGGNLEEWPPTTHNIVK